jgi:hypothetical protein
MNSDKKTVDDILKELNNDDMSTPNGDNVDINIEDILKESEYTLERNIEGSHGQRSSTRFDFQPTLEKTSPKLTSNIDKDLQDIINQADEMYGNIDNIKVDEGRLNEILAMENEHITFNKKEEENVPYKSKIIF